MHVKSLAPWYINTVRLPKDCYTCRHQTCEPLSNVLYLQVAFSKYRKHFVHRMAPSLQGSHYCSVGPSSRQRQWRLVHLEVGYSITVKDYWPKLALAWSQVRINKTPQLSVSFWLCSVLYWGRLLRVPSYFSTLSQSSASRDLDSNQTHLVEKCPYQLGIQVWLYKAPKYYSLSTQAIWNPLKCGLVRRASI